MKIQWRTIAFFWAAFALGSVCSLVASPWWIALGAGVAIGIYAEDIARWIARDA